MKRKLDVGGTLSQIFSTHGDQAGVLLPVAFGLFLLVAVINGILGAIGAGVSDSFGMRALVNVIASTLTAPIAALAASTIYFNLLGPGSEPASDAPSSASPV